MSEDFESRLRAALRPVAPSDDFTQDLIARVTAAQGPQSAQRALNRQRRGASAGWFAAAAAAWVSPSSSRLAAIKENS